MRAGPRIFTIGLKSEWSEHWECGLTMVIENIKWGLIAAAIWFGIYHIATVVGATPVF